jgi:hypothetical protein
MNPFTIKSINCEVQKNKKYIVMLNAHKNLLNLVGFLVVMMIGNVAYGQTNTVKTNLANLAISGGSIHYERAINDASSAQLGIFLSAVTVDDTKFSGFGIIPQYRYYPGDREVQSGFYIAPLIGYQVFSLESTLDGSNSEANFTLFGAGLDIGNKWLLGAFAVELSAGISFNSTNLEIKTGIEDDFSLGGFGSTTPRVGVSFGYAF